MCLYVVTARLSDFLGAFNQGGNSYYAAKEKAKTDIMRHTDFLGIIWGGGERYCCCNSLEWLTRLVGAQIIVGAW